MAAENNNSWAWEIFLRLLCEEGSGEATRESVLYRLIIERFPIQFMQKLLSTAVDNSIEQSDDRIGEHAAAVMIELNDANLLERNYTRIEDTQTLDSLRRSALDLTVDHEVGSGVQVCGEQTAFKLLRQSLELEERWDVFLDFAEECFTRVSAASTPGDLRRLFAIVRGLPWHLRDKLVRFMEARITRKRRLFETRMAVMLHHAHDDSPFLILPSIIRTFDQTISPTLTQWAIMTRFFNDQQSPHTAVRVAEIYVYCIQHTSLTNPFPFSFDDFGIMARIICGLAHFLRNSRNLETANRLIWAFVEKFEAYYPHPDPPRREE